MCAAGGVALLAARPAYLVVGRARCWGQRPMCSAVRACLPGAESRGAWATKAGRPRRRSKDRWVRAAGAYLLQNICGMGRRDEVVARRLNRGSRDEGSAALDAKTAKGTAERCR